MNRIPTKLNKHGAGVSDKSSRLTGDALDVAKEFLHFIFGHLHKMVLVEPANVLCREVGCDREDCLARDLAGFGRMLESTISVCTFFTFASKISTQLNGQVPGEDIGWIDVRILEEEHSHFLPVFGRAVDLATFFSLFRLLTTGGGCIIHCFGSGGIAFVTTMLRGKRRANVLILALRC